MLSNAKSTLSGDDAAHEADLLLRIRNGDEQAMAALFKLHSRMVYGIAVRVLNDASQAEDLLQEMFMQVWKRPEAFDASRGRLSAFLAVATRNRAIDALRSRRQEQLPEHFDVASTFNLAEDSERRLLIEKVRTVAAGLPPDQQHVLNLAFFQGLTHSEIATETSIPLGTVKTRIRSALMALERTLTV